MGAAVPPGLVAGLVEEAGERQRDEDAGTGTAVVVSRCDQRESISPAGEVGAGAVDAARADGRFRCSGET
jgi:hypothetical protein